MNTRYSYKVVIALVLILLIAGWFTYRVVSTHQATSQQTDVAQSFTNSASDQYTSLNGEVIDVDEYFGEVMVVNSWASWSPQSREQLNTLSMLAEEFQGNAVHFLAINRSEPNTTAEAYLNSVTIAEELTIILDDTDNFYQTIEAYAMPVTLVYGKEGDLVYEAAGEFSLDKIKRIIEEQLAL